MEPYNPDINETVAEISTLINDTSDLTTLPDDLTPDKTFPKDYDNPVRAEKIEAAKFNPVDEPQGSTPGKMQCTKQGGATVCKISFEKHPLKGGESFTPLSAA